jgi:hypothetical protein
MIQFKKHIPGINVDDLLKKSQSQLGQDLFTIAMLQGKTHGKFLELGGYHPYFASNTYLLEKEFAWTGVSIDIVDETKNQERKQIFWNLFYNSVKDPSWPDSINDLSELPTNIQKECVNVHNYNFYFDQRFKSWQCQRPNSTFILDDAVNVDYQNLDGPFDFLQIDLDSVVPSLKALSKALQFHRFSVIVFEHDVGNTSQNRLNLKQTSKQIIESYGYEMVINNVTIPPHMSIDTPFFNHHIEDWYVCPNTVSREIIDAYKWIDSSDDPKFPSTILFK